MFHATNASTDRNVMQLVGKLSVQVTTFTPYTRNLPWTHVSLLPLAWQYRLHR